MSAGDLLKIECASREEWLQRRLEGIGSSEAASLWVEELAAMTPPEKPFKTPLALYAEKTGATSPDSDPSERMKWGLRLEPAIAAAFAEEKQLEVIAPKPFTIWRHEGAPMQATPDRLVPDGELCVLEIKTAGNDRWKEWRDGPPLKYAIQVQHQLCVMGLRRAFVAVLIGGDDFRIYDVEANDEWASQHVRRCVAFWDAVTHREQPEPVAADVDTLRELWQQAQKGKHVRFTDPLFDGLLDELQASKAAAKAAEEKAAAAQARLMDALKDAESAEFPSGRGVTWKNQVTRFEAKPAREQVSRVFRIKT